MPGQQDQFRHRVHLLASVQGGAVAGRKGPRFSGGATESGLVNNPILYSKLAYDPNKDFVPVTRLFDGQAVYVVRSGIGVNSIKDFVEYAKQMNGKASYGSSGTGGTTHLALAWLGESSKVQLIHVPYRGLGPALQDLISGRIDMMLAPLPLIEPHLSAGRIKPIAVTGRSRLPQLPDVPTVYETGDGALDITFYLGLVAPLETPPGIVSKLATTARSVACSQAFADLHAKPYGYISVCDTPAEFKTFLKKDEVVRRDRIRVMNIRLD